jgi:hypothetical protein
LLLANCFPAATVARSKVREEIEAEVDGAICQGVGDRWTGRERERHLGKGWVMIWRETMTIFIAPRMDQSVVKRMIPELNGRQRHCIVIKERKWSIGCISAKTEVRTQSTEIDWKVRECQESRRKDEVANVEQ